MAEQSRRGFLTFLFGGVASATVLASKPAKAFAIELGVYVSEVDHSAVIDPAQAFMAELKEKIREVMQVNAFERNDKYTQTRVREEIAGFLREKQEKRIVYDFHVVCDETVNTPEVIDSNDFAGCVYLKPVNSINFTTLDFRARNERVETTELVSA